MGANTDPKIKRVEDVGPRFDGYEISFTSERNGRTRCSVAKPGSNYVYGWFLDVPTEPYKMLAAKSAVVTVGELRAEIGLV